MERDEFVAIVAPLVLAMRTTFDRPTWTVYYRALEDVSPGLLQAAVDDWAKSGAEFMPKPGQLRAGAEKARAALSAAHPFEGCESCKGTGWADVLVDGVNRVTRCECWKAHQYRLSGMGVSTTPLQLVAGEREGDDA